MEGKPSEKKHVLAKRTCFLWSPEVTTPHTLTISFSVVFTTRLLRLPARLVTCQLSHSSASTPARVVSTGRLFLRVRRVKVSTMENTAYRRTPSASVKTLLLSNALFSICTFAHSLYCKRDARPLRGAGLPPRTNSGTKCS